MSAYILLEGPEGSGKSTQVRLVAQELQATGSDVLLVHEPGGTSVGETIRSLLLSQTDDPMSLRAEILLFGAARAELSIKVIQPHLAKGGLVLSDRGFLSSFAYQGYARKLGSELVETICRIAMETTWPDLVIVLDVPIAIGLARRFGDTQALSRFDLADVEFHEEVRRGYLTEAKCHGYPVVDGTSSPEDVTLRLLKVIEERLPNLNLTAEVKSTTTL